MHISSQTYQTHSHKNVLPFTNSNDKYSNIQYNLTLNVFAITCNDVSEDMTHLSPCGWLLHGDRSLPSGESSQLLRDFAPNSSESSSSPSHSESTLRLHSVRHSSPRFTAATDEQCWGPGGRRGRQLFTLWHGQGESINLVSIQKYTRWMETLRFCLNLIWLLRKDVNWRRIWNNETVPHSCEESLDSI